jgi:hypothetical protein
MSLVKACVCMFVIKGGSSSYTSKIPGKHFVLIGVSTFEFECIYICALQSLICDIMEIYFCFLLFIQYMVLMR